MTKVKLFPLKCVRSNGRWNKGDIASFEAERAKVLVKSKNWVETDLPDADGDEDDQGSESSKAPKK